MKSFASFRRRRSQAKYASPPASTIAPAPPSPPSLPHVPPLPRARTFSRRTHASPAKNQAQPQPHQSSPQPPIQAPMHAALPEEQPRPPQRSAMQHPSSPPVSWTRRASMPALRRKKTNQTDSRTANPPPPTTAAAPLPLPPCATSLSSPQSPRPADICPSLTRRVTAPQESFRLGTLPSTRALDLDLYLGACPPDRIRILRKAHLVRAGLANSLQHKRSLSLLTAAADEYLPYGLSLMDIEREMRENGKDLPPPLVWESGLSAQSPAQVFEADFAFDAAMVIMLCALNRVRAVLETAGRFGAYAYEDDYAVADRNAIDDIKKLAVAAGMLTYAHDRAIPNALSSYRGASPPAELAQSVAALLLHLAQAAAQLLLMRRVLAKAGSDGVVAGLSASARRHARAAVDALDACHRAHVVLSPGVATAAHELSLLASGCALRFAAPMLGTPAQKVAVLRAALQNLEQAKDGRIVAKLAHAQLDGLHGLLADAVNENRVAFQDAIPHVDDLRLPEPLSISKPEPFKAARVAETHRPLH